jgi:16S rRNA (uracil1498-N3)-methyltransferase
VPFDSRSPFDPAQGDLERVERSGHAERSRGGPFARFYAPAAGVTGDRILLPVDEADHLTRVLRLSVGDRVRVFDGRGAEYEAVVATQDRHGVRLLIGAPCSPAPEPRVAITLAQAVLKGDKMDEVVRDAVMIGVAAIQPVVTARTEITIAALNRGRRRERWERIAVSSAKQCGRAVVPRILEPQPFAAVSLPPPIIVLVEPGIGSGVPLRDLDLNRPDQATLLVGPEGGWSADEVRVAATFGTLVTLGGRTLRADAMALVAVAAVCARWREF